MFSTDEKEKKQFISTDEFPDLKKNRENLVPQKLGHYAFSLNPFIARFTFVL